MVEIKNLPELGKYVTFEQSKDLPIYRWFYYKEAFCPQIVEFAIKNEKISSGTIFDPFCGIGTTLLAAKKENFNSIGVDVSPLATFISETKSADYSTQDILEIKNFIDGVFKNRMMSPKLLWNFELFPTKIAFPQSNLNTILYLREEIQKLSNNPRNFLLLALLSIIPQVSLVKKDGGVLKIDKNKITIPAKEAFKRKVKKMLFDIENSAINGPTPKIILNDARNVPEIKDDSIELVVTSPPYLNNIDYSKVYGLELTLLELDKEITKKTRSHLIRSFISGNWKTDNIPIEVGEIGNRIPVIGTYFTDMEYVIKEIFRILKPGKSCYFIVTNSIIFDTHIIVDEVIAEMAERIGFSSSEILVCLERLADVKPRKVKTRESIVVMRK